MTAIAIPARLYPLRRHAVQLAYANSPARFNVVPAGRRSGKTERAKRKVIKRALGEMRYDDARFFCAAPTRDQAKTIYWRDIKRMVDPLLLLEPPSETALTVRYVNGSENVVVGMDKPERMEGSPWNGGILDEFGNMKPQAWGENVRPALADRNGWCDLIGVPEGRNHYYDLYRYARDSGDPEWSCFTWPSADILPAHEIESARRNLDELVFDQEYNASFVNFVGRAYYPFLAETHTGDLTYNPRAPIGFCFDFNVEPGVAVIVQEQVLPNGLDGTGIIGEVHIPRNSSTPAVCRKLIADWGEHQGLIRCYGDSTGGNRGSAKIAGSDWDLIKIELGKHFGHGQVEYRVPGQNGPERSRVNALNSRLKSATGDIRCMVAGSEAPMTIHDLEGVQLLKGGAGEIDKNIDKKLTHLTDALGYYMVKEYPIVKSIVQDFKMF